MKNIKFIAIILIVLAGFNVLAFVVPTVKTDGFWVGYGFTMFAIFLCFGVNAYEGKEKNNTSRFYKLPLTVLSDIYLMIQLIIGLVMMYVAIIPAWIGIVASVALLVIVAIGLISLDINNSTVEKIDRQIRRKVFYIKNLQADIELMSETSTGENTKKMLWDLAQTVRYSDPMSADSLLEIEVDICNSVQELGKIVKTDDAIAISEKILATEQLLSKRNKMCKLLK